MHWYVMNILVNILNIDTRSIIWRLGAPFVIGIIVIMIAYCK